MHFQPIKIEFFSKRNWHTLRVLNDPCIFNQSNRDFLENKLIYPWELLSKRVLLTNQNRNFLKRAILTNNEWVVVDFFSREKNFMSLLLLEALMYIIILILFAFLWCGQYVFNSYNFGTCLICLCNSPVFLFSFNYHG